MSTALSSFQDLDSIDPYAVRWYYSATSSVTPGAMDIPGKSDLVRFSDGDSLLLETVYRKHAGEYDECWLQQQAAFMEARKDKATPPAAPEPKQAELEPRGPVLRAGYFEADIKARTVYPVYWPGEQSTLIRGTWFVVSSQGRNLIPLPHPLACKLEHAWQTRVYDCTTWDDHKLQPEGVHATRVDLNDVSGQSYYALFCERNKIYLCSKDNLSFLKGLWAEAPGAMLVRGYSSAVDAQAPQGKKTDPEEADLATFESRTVGMAVRHVVMAVHGIGQRMGGRTIVEDAQAVRSRINAMLDDHMHDEIGRGYIQVLPIQWRKNLDLEADRVADRIMPEGARTFRMLAHNTCVEVLMYMSPSHAQNIVDSVANNLNSTYLKFIRRHPEFSGKFSVLAYSLGSVLCYDLLSHQPMRQESALARGLDNLVARQALAAEGGSAADDSSRWPARTAADGHGSVMPDASHAAATPRTTVGTAPNSSRTEGPGPIAVDQERRQSGTGDSAEGKSGNSNAGWAAGLWKALADKFVGTQNSHDDGDHITDGDAFDKLAHLDAAPQRMLEEANKARKSVKKPRDGVRDTAPTNSGSGASSAAESCVSTPVAASPRADGERIFSDNRSAAAWADNSGPVHEGVDGAAGELLAALREGGSSSGDGKTKEGGGVGGKLRRSVHRWRFAIPKPWGGKKNSAGGACATESGSQNGAQEEGGETKESGAAVPAPGDLEHGGTCCGGSGGASTGDRGGRAVSESRNCSLAQVPVAPHTASREGAEVPHANAADEAEGRYEGMARTGAAMHRSTAASLQTAPAEITVATACCIDAAVAVGARARSLDMARSPAHALRPGAVASCGDLRTAGMAGNGGAVAAACEPLASVPCSDVGAAGHAVQDSSARLGAVPGAVPPSQPELVAESAVHGTPCVSTQPAELRGQGGSSHAGGAAERCRNSHEGSAPRMVSQLTKELRTSACTSVPQEASNHGTLQQLRSTEPAAVMHDHTVAQNVFAGMHATPPASLAAPVVVGCGSGDSDTAGVVEHLHADSAQHAEQRTAVLTELQLLEAQQAQVNERIAQLRAAMQSDTTTSSAPAAHLCSTDVATGAQEVTPCNTCGVGGSGGSGPHAVSMRQGMITHHPAAANMAPPGAAAASSDDGAALRTGQHSTYGMGELMDEEVDGVMEGGILSGDGGMEQAGSPVKGAIERARVLWPGNALHELDQQQKVPLSTQAVQYPKLFFDVENFIMIGSPTGLFCALRGINPSQETPLGSLAAGFLDPAAAPGCLPVCRRFYNMFHPYDPVAYRMEPLVQNEEVPKPQHVPYHKNGKKLHIGLAETSENVARTMNQWQKGVAHAFTFSFKRSKSGVHEQSVAVQDLQQFSLIPTILGAPVPHLPPDCLPSLPTLEIDAGGLSASLPSQPSSLQYSLSHAPSSGGTRNASNEGTNSASGLERTCTSDRLGANANTTALNHSSLPPLVEEASNLTSATVADAPSLQPTFDAADPTGSLDGGTDGYASGPNSRCSIGTGTPRGALEVPPSMLRQECSSRRPKSVPTSPQQATKLAMPSPRAPCMSSASSPDLPDGPQRTLTATCSAANLQLPPLPKDPVVGGSHASSPISSSTPTAYARNSSCIQHATDQGTPRHQRSSVPRLQNTACDSASVHASMHAAYASVSQVPPLRSPSMLSLPAVGAASIDGGSTSGVRADGAGRASGETSARLLKPRPTLARAGQFGLVSRGQGGSVGRLDFQLQEDFAELQWVGAFKAHFCYWKHDDVALFICRAACGYDVVDGRKEEQPAEPVEPGSPSAP